MGGNTIYLISFLYLSHLSLVPNKLFVLKDEEQISVVCAIAFCKMPKVNVNNTNVLEGITGEENEEKVYCCN